MFGLDVILAGFKIMKFFRCMLNVAVERESEGDLWEMDIG
jgi:hypothetical protein